MPKLFKLYEEEFLLRVAETAQQLKNSIEQIAIGTKTQIDGLPPSTINTDTLYRLVLGYLEIHDRALDASLLTKTIKLNGTIH